MLTSHKIKTLQIIFQSIWDNVQFIDQRINRFSPSIEDIDTVDLLMSMVLEDVALWRANKAEFFQDNKGGENS